VNACDVSPGSSVDAITVGATDSSDSRASFSNYGSCLDIFGPGVSIYSAGTADNNDLRSMSGTSMATPHVAGAAVQYLSAYPSATPAQVKSALLSLASAGFVSNPGSNSPNRLLHIMKSTSPNPPTPPVDPPTPPPRPPPATPPPAPAPVPSPSPPPPTPAPVPSPSPPAQCSAKWTRCDADAECCSGRCRGRKEKRACR